MIDIESQIFTMLSELLEAQFPGILVTNEHLNASSVFPCVSITESDNYMPASNLDTSGEQRFNVVMYEISGYSNKKAGRRAECREIIRAVDTKLYSMNFTRLSMTPVPNLFNASIYRITARYRAEIDGQYIYRR